MDPKLKTYLDGEFSSLRSEIATKIDLKNLEDNLSDQFTSVSQTFTKILTQVEDEVEELKDIVSDTGLGGRVHKLEIDVKELKTKVA